MAFPLPLSQTGTRFSLASSWPSYQSSGHSAQPQHGVSPSNGWIDRSCQPLHGDLFVLFCVPPGPRCGRAGFHSQSISIIVLRFTRPHEPCPSLLFMVGTLPICYVLRLVPRLNLRWTSNCGTTTLSLMSYTSNCFGHNRR